MPTKNVQKPKPKLNIFLIIGLIFIIAAGIFFVLYFLTPSFSLSCSGPSSQIKCDWKNCELKNPPDMSEIVFAKVPNYVKTVNITETSGSVILTPPSPVSGQYTVYLSCNNGKLATRVIL